MSKNRFSKSSPLLLSPGPVILHPEIQKSLSQAMIHHRSLEFENNFKQISQGLKALFETKQEVLLLTSTGTGAMEAGFVNGFSPQEEVICVGGGKFGERWHDMAQAYGLTSHFIDVKWGQAVTLDQIQKKLLAHPKTKALIVTACETSTGTQHPIEDISQLLKNNYPKLLFIVDAITGLGAMPLKMDEWGIDVMVAGSQKSFWLPAGLSFICLSKKAWDKTSNSKLPKYYFDLTREKKAQLKGQTAFSSPVSMTRALTVSLGILNQQGLTKLISRCENLKNSTHAFCKVLNLNLYSSQPANSITAIEIENADELKKQLEQNHHVITAGGQGSLKNKVLRVGHLGPLKKESFLVGLAALAMELNKRDPSRFSEQKTQEALKQAESYLKNI